MGKILLIANHVDWLYNLRFELIEALIMDGHEVYFLVPQDSANPNVKLLIHAGAKYFQVDMSSKGTNPFEDLSLTTMYQKMIADIDPDVILTYTIKPNIYGTYASSINGKPTIMNITGIGSSLVSGRLKALVKWMYRCSCKKASVVFFQNQSNLDFFLENNMVHPTKTKLIPGSGVNLSKFRPMDKISKNDETIRFLFIGRIMKDKGINEYIKAAARITEQYPNTEFQILGSYEEEQYREQIESNPSIKYLGRSNDVREQIREVDCIVHPSYHEGMSNVLLEGAAMGKPLIASNIPGCKEIIDHGLNGYLFEPKSVDSIVDRLQLFLELDGNERLNMGLASRRKVEKEFDRNIVVGAYLQAINKITDRK